MLERLGFKPVRQTGSHLFFKHDDGRETVVPMHKGEDLGRGLIRKIINQVKISRKEFLKELEEI